MDINDLMKLVNAGFTKKEIMALNGNVTETEPKPTEDINAQQTETPVENKATAEETKPQTPPQTNVNFAPMMTDAQIEKLAQMLNRGSASIDVPPQKNAEDILGEHYKDLFNGK